MTLTTDPRVPLRSPDRFFIGGEWVAPSSDATIDVIDSEYRAVVLQSRRGAACRHGPRDRVGAGARSTGVRGLG